MTFHANTAYTESMKRNLLLAFFLISLLTGSAQYSPSATVQAEDSVRVKPQSWFKTHGVADKLDVSVTLGTTGIGGELSVPVTKWASFRVGFDGVPPVKLPMYFPLGSYAEGNVAGRLDEIKKLMLRVTGEEMEDEVKVNAKPNFYNFKFLIDFYPFRDSRFHFTAGVYVGSGTIGTALNAESSTSTLVAMNIYNRFYDRLKNYNYDEEPFFGDIYLSKERYDELMSYGDMGVHIGDYKDGRPYLMKPSSNGTMSAKAYANSVRPYFGVGYSKGLGASRRFQIGFDAGVLIWGGAPKVILNDGTDMSNLTDIRGKVGDYFSIINSLAVYPAVAVKFSYSLF